MASQKVNAQEDNVSFIGPNDIKRGSYVVLRKKFPCKVVEIHKSAPGKHGAAKIRVVGLEIFSGKKYDDIFQGGSMVMAPEVKKTDYQLMFILEDDYVKLHNPTDGTIREDIKLVAGEELHDSITGDYYDDKTLIVTVLSCMNQEQIVTFKVDNKRP